METSMLSFSFDQSISIRTVIIDHEPWFVAKDVAAALGYAEPHKAVARHCKRAKSLIDMDGTFHPVQQNQLLTQLDRKTKLIPEPDVYRLISNSQLPSAERFETWIFEEVLPSIRKSGGYQLPAPAPTFEKINSADAQAIANIIHNIKYHFHYKEMASHAIYSGLRRAYGLEHSIANLPACYFHEILDVLAQFERASRGFQGVILDTEKAFFGRVFRRLLPFNDRDWQQQIDHDVMRLDDRHNHTLQLIDQNMR